MTTLIDPLVIQLVNYYVIDCGICGVRDDQINPLDRKAIPFLNGEPTSSTGECDGYKAVCPKCYNRWLYLDNQLTN